jgi:hypothetical protein
MPRGGARPGAGRPFGSKDVRPRKSTYLKDLGDMAVEYDKSEYFITNPDRVFAGNSLDLMVAMYKCEELPVRVRLYAAGKAAEYELTGGKSIEEVRAEIEAEQQEDPEESRRQTIELISHFVRYAVHETQSRLAGRAKGRAGPPAWIADLVDELLAERGEAEVHASEITPPAPT